MVLIFLLRGLVKSAGIKNHQKSQGKWQKGGQDKNLMEIARAIHRIANQQYTAGKQENTYEDQKGRRERITIWGIFLNAGLIVIQCLIFWLTLQEARNASNAQHVDTLAALDKATEANTEARRVADAAALAQRAWIAPVSVKLESPIDSTTQVVAIFVTVLNVGHQPAMDIAASAVVDAVPSEPGPPDKHACLGVVPDTGNSIIYPSDQIGATLRYAADFSKSPTEMDDIRAGRYLLYIEGCVAYQTLGKPRYSQYCFYLYPEFGPQTGYSTPRPLAEWQFKSCPIGNKAI